MSEHADNTYLIRGNTVASDDRKASRQTFSAWELEILRMIASGITNREIAGRLFVSVSTVKLCVRRTLEKLDVDDRTEAAVVATKRELI